MIVLIRKKKIINLQINIGHNFSFFKKKNLHLIAWFMEFAIKK